MPWGLLGPVGFPLGPLAGAAPRPPPAGGAPSGLGAAGPASRAPRPPLPAWDNGGTGTKLPGTVPRHGRGRGVFCSPMQQSRLAAVALLRVSVPCPTC